MKITKKSLAALGVTAAIAFAAMPAFAQDTTQTPTEPSAATEESTSEPTTRDERMADRQAAFAETLAAELDLPVDQVTDAITAVHEQLRADRDAEHQAALQERLDDAVANGDLTQEQADAMAAAAEAGVLGGPRGHGHRDAPPALSGFGPPAGTPDAGTEPTT